MTRAGPLAPRPDGPPPVAFALLEGLLARRPRLRGRVREFLPPVLIGLAHLWILLSVRQAAPAVVADGSLAALETATYLDVPPPPEPESPRAVVRPRRVAVSDAVTIPAAQGDILHPEKVAGFQELLAPRDVAGLPPPGADGAVGAPVDERDFSGRGIVGGVAGGKPAPVLPAALAAAMALGGELSDELAAARARRAVQPLELGEVQVHPELRNRQAVQWALLNSYPASLREAGIEGSATVQVVVDTTGAVEEGSAKVLSATHPLFGQAALEVVRRAEFTPARTVLDGRLQAVPVLVRMPLRWMQR